MQLSKICFVVCGLWLSLTAYASDDDFSQPIRVDAKTTFADGIKKMTILKDGVRITQGSLIILADEVRVDAALGEGNEVFIALGAPAQYSQTIQDGSQVAAQAREIRYTVNNKTIQLLGAAQLKQNSSQVNGETIIFDMQNEQFSALGDKNTESRVSAVFQTKKSLEKQQNKDDEGQR
ncbi:MAG: lipopolysaccharide transport periplasmic protein LptA [Glaciecola sp.]|jgi:lipopolysaccharide export system protein LptA